MSNPNSFLRSPFEELIDQQNKLAAATDAQAVAVPEAPAAPVATADPVPAPAAPTGAAGGMAAPKSDNLAPPEPMRASFESAAKQYGVPANVLMALAQQESTYNPMSVNKTSGAKGLMNYMDATSKSLDFNPFDADSSIQAAAKQIRERLDKGYSMDDAVKEHFAGPNRDGWKEKTHAYGTEVLDKARKIGALLYPEDAPAAADTAPAGTGTATPESLPKIAGIDQNKFSTAMPRSAYLANFQAMNPQADAKAIEAVMAQYDTAQAARTKAGGNRVQDKFAQMASPEATFNAKLNEKLQGGNEGLAQALPGNAQPANPAGAPAARPDIATQAAGDFGRGMKNLQALGYGVAGLAAEASGKTDDATDFLNKYVAIQNETAKSNPATIGTYKNIKGLGDAGRYAIEAVAENLPMLLPSLVTGGVGALGAKEAAKRLVVGMVQSQVEKGVAREVAEAATAKFVARTIMTGSAAGAAASSVPMETGSIMGDIYQDTGKKAVGTALAYGVPAGLLDTLEPVMALRKIAGPLADHVAGSIFKRLGVEAGKQFITEAGTEGLQTILEEAAKTQANGKKLFTPELADSVIDSMLKGGIGGAGIGTMSQGVHEARAALDTPARQIAREIDGQVAGTQFTGADAAARAALDPNAGTIDPSQTRMPSAEPVAAAPAPTAPATGPLTAATHDAAAGAAPKVTAETPQGVVTGTLLDSQANGDALIATILDDDGVPHVFNSADGGQITPAAAPAGPLSAALGAAAVIHDANPAPVPEMPPAPAKPAGPVPLEGMSMDELKARITYVNEQAQRNGGATSETMKERKRVEKQMKVLADHAVATSKPAEEPFTMGPFDDIKAANKMLIRAAESTGQMHEVVEKDGKFTIRPYQEKSDGTGNSNDMGQAGDVGGRGNRPASGDKPVDGHGSDADRAVRGGAGDSAAVDRADGVGSAKSDDAASGAANGKPALTPHQVELKARKAAREKAAGPSVENFTDKQIDSEWNKFAKKSGTLGIERAEMPQIKAEHRGALTQFLLARGIAHEQVEMPAHDLKATQAEFSPAKVEKARAYEGGDRSILVSSDNHVLDGHHQWLAKLDDNAPVKVIKLDAPIRDLLAQVKEFPSAEAVDGASTAKETANVEPTAPAAPKPAAPAGKRTKREDGKPAKPVPASVVQDQTPVAEYERDPYKPYAFSTQALADAFMVKKSVDAAQFEVKQTGEKRWQVVPREAETAGVEAFDVPKQRRAPNTDAFKDWSGRYSQSKAKGVFYHKTKADFDTFDPAKRELGFHFGTLEQAEGVAVLKDNAPGTNIMPVRLAIKNPLRLKDEGSFHADGVANQLAKKSIITKALAKQINSEIDADWKARRKWDDVVRVAIQDAGFDGIVYKNEHEGDGDSWIAFEPNQIKSAIGNNGNYDKNDNNITHDIPSERTIEVDGVRRPINNSAGRPVAQTFAGQMAFWKWFADSKTVDAKGRPQVVFHGTDSDVAQFKGSRFYFSDQADYASAYADKKGGNVIPTYLSMRSPLDITDLGSGAHSEQTVLNALAAKGVNVSGLRGLVKAKGGVDGIGIWAWWHNEKVRAALKDSGFDSVVQMEETGAGKSKAYIVFAPEQIKSATGNNGNFDPTDANITHDITPLMADGPLSRMDEPKRVATLQKLRQIHRQRAEGQIDDEQYRNRIESLIGKLEDRNASKTPAPRERGVEWVTERLMRARRLGELDAPTVDFALWALEKSPSLANDLAVSIRTGKNGTAGSYQSAERLISLFKGVANEGTAVHEILHHSERMMPEAIQQKITQSWFDAYMREFDKSDAPTKALMEDMLSMGIDPKAAARTIKAFADGKLSYEKHYQLVNASEFWAVNATRIMSERFAAQSWQAKAKRWMAEMMEKVKALLKLPSDAAVLKGLQSVLNGTGERLSSTMLMEQTTFHDTTKKTDAPDPASKTSVLSSDQVDAALDASRWLDKGLKLGKAQKIYRGTSERTGENTANFGRGLYVTTDKKEAAQYGTVAELDRSVLPSNPIRFSDEGKFREWESFVAREIFGYRRLSEFEKDHGTPDQWVREIYAGIDGIQIGTGHGAFFVKFPDRSPTLFDIPAQAGAAPATAATFKPSDDGVKAALRTVQSAIQDNQNRINQVQANIVKVSGAALPARADYYAAETNRPGRIAARLEDMRDGLIEPLMQKLAKSGHTMEQLEELLHAMHAQERNEAVAKINPDMPDGGSGMKTADADEIIKKYRAANELHQLADQARAIAGATLDMKRAYGLLTDEKYEALAQAYEHYVPLKGDGEYGPKVKRAMGHDERAEFIVQNIARDYAQAVVVGEKNLARQSLLQMVLQFPDAELWTARMPPKGRYVAGQVFFVKKGDTTVASYTDQAEVNAFLEAKGAEAGLYTVVDSAGESVAQFTKPLQDNEVMVYVKGQAVRLQILDEKLAAQLRPLNVGQMAAGLEVMRHLNGYLSKIYTGYNPAFILRNTARDAMTGTINMMGNQGAAIAAKSWAKYPAALATMVKWAHTKNVPTGKMGQYLNEYRQHGGKVGASYMSDLEDTGKSIERMYDDAAGLVRTAKSGSARRTAIVVWDKTVMKLAHAVEVANQGTENALRLSLFAALREAGHTPGQAAQAAKGVTVDFDRKGTATGALGAVYLFTNPAIQGTANAMRTLSSGKNKGQAWAVLGALGTLGYFLAAAGMDDDKDRWMGESWDTRTKNVRYRVGSKIINIPVSQEFAPFFAFGTAMAEAARGESKAKASARILSSFLDAYVPLKNLYNPDSEAPMMDAVVALTPTIASNLVQTAVNRNSFGSKIVPESDNTKGHPDNLKMNRGTKNSTYDTVAQAVAGFGVKTGMSREYENDITKISPETLKLWWRAYTGGLGSFIADTVGVARMGADNPGQIEVSDVPFAKDFVKPVTMKPIQGRYYDLTKDARQAIDEFHQAKKAGNEAAMEALTADPDKEKLIGLGRMVRQTTKAAGKLADEAVEINGQKDLTGTEKRAALKALEKEQEELYRAGIEAFTEK